MLGERRVKLGLCSVRLPDTSGSHEKGMKGTSYVMFGKDHLGTGSSAGVFKGLKVC